jgi:5-methylcytosine-specific restriction endonuclease McrA
LPESAFNRSEWNGPSSGRCRPCLAAYQRQWAASHPESRRATYARYGAAHPEKRRAYADRTKDRKRELAKRRYAADPERWAAQGRAWYTANRDRKQAKAREWRRLNPAKARGVWQRRKARIRNAQISPVDFDRILARDGWICHICGGFILRDELSFDHIVPLAKGGAHSEENLSPAHLNCNKGKAARLVVSKAPPRISRKR